MGSDGTAQVRAGVTSDHGSYSQTSDRQFDIRLLCPLRGSTEQSPTVVRLANLLMDRSKGFGVKVEEVALWTRRLRYGGFASVWASLTRPVLRRFELCPVRRRGLKSSMWERSPRRARSHTDALTNGRH
ncbi:hypothetical protein E2C01_042326 [Portunus trituberculatus]|uniref:Uncharacterized protein n=1 Tax=Portunus trituberculatus TaxID=210409 RepID=A0A5B7FLI7_PORTR|nr:hypothetical protein [Portunus trituberculatus]